jgi:hypothetical protein
MPATRFSNAAGCDLRALFDGKNKSCFEPKHGLYFYNCQIICQLFTQRKEPTCYRFTYQQQNK